MRLRTPQSFHLLSTLRTMDPRTNMPQLQAVLCAEEEVDEGLLDLTLSLNDSFA